MPPASPRELSAAFAEAVNRRDLAGAAELWAQDAVIVGAGGETISGPDAVPGVLRALMDSGVVVEVHVATLHEAGDVAIASGTLTLTSPDGHRQSSSSVVVYTRQQDGWRIAVDAPWGLAGL